MHLNRTIRIQLAIFTVVATAAVALVGFSYVRFPSWLFGIGRYTVTVDLAKSGNLYPNSNVTYRGAEVGRVTTVRLTDTGVQADLSLDSDVPIPSDLDAEVHSVTAVGEQYVDLLPRNGTSPPLKDGDVIQRDRTSIPPDISSLLDAANRGVEAIPNDSLKTVIDESYTALAGLGPEFARLVKGGTTLAIDARKNLDAIVTLVEDSAPVLDSQTDTADSIHAWAANLATMTQQLRTEDAGLAGVLEKGPGALDETRQLIDRLNPTLPTVLANLVSVGEVALVYQPSIEQLLVLLPQGVRALQGAVVANHNTKQDYKGLYMSFNLNFNLPPPCLTGFLPAQQRRDASFQDAPDRPAGDLYCRTPQDSLWNVRGARNYPCVPRPGKRAPTAAMCESDEQYVPLNNGENWKGDPNATLTGQDIPQLPTGSPPTGGAPHPAPAAAVQPLAPPLAAAEYDPATGAYIGPDGQTYTQANLAQTAPKEQTWQSMLMPPPAN
jgi:phospholipid/cholesterol/gamma-HCH transport system substrate-binding protein